MKDLLEIENCKLCKFFKDYQKSYQILTRALFHKYSQSQDYFYGNIVKKLLNNHSNKILIELKDDMILLNESEYLKKVYTNKKFPKKQKALTDYYKYHIEIPRVYMLPMSLVFYHDRKRRINYYRVKKILHEQQGGGEPLQITPEETSDSSESSDPSQSNFQMSKFLRSHLLKSFQKNSILKSEIKDTIQEINFFLSNQSYLNLKEVEQQSYFLMDDDSFQIIQQNFQIQKSVQNKIKVDKQNDKQKQIVTTNKINKSPQKLRTRPILSQKVSNQEQEIKQLAKQKSTQDFSKKSDNKAQIIQYELQESQFLNKIKNLSDFYRNNLTNKNKQDQFFKQISKQKKQNFRTQSQMNLDNIYTPQNNFDKIQKYQQTTRNQKPQSQIKFTKKKVQSQDKKSDEMKMSAIMSGLKDKIFQPNMMILSPNSIINIKQTFNNYTSPQFINNNNFEKKQQFQNKPQKQQPLSANRVRRVVPQSMQLSEEFIQKIQKQSQSNKNQNLQNMIQNYQKTQQNSFSKDKNMKIIFKKPIQSFKNF